jgi:hypothetical protein
MFFDKSTQTDSLISQMALKHPLSNADLTSNPPAKKARYDMEMFAREDKDYSSLQLFFLNETSPFDLDAIAIYIGFPPKKLEQLKYDNPQNCQKMMKKMFEIWFPIAQQAAHVDDITPREILAYAYHSLTHTLNCNNLLDSQQRRAFVKSNGKKFELLSMAIEKRIRNLEEEMSTTMD